jgi:hypothetical protein
MLGFIGNDLHLHLLLAQRLATDVKAGGARSKMGGTLSTGAREAKAGGS